MVLASNTVPPPSPGYKTDNPTDLTQGDIVVVTPSASVMAEPRLAIIIEEPADTIIVALASNLTWLATGSDPILESGLTDLGYSICVFSRITGAVRPEQIVRLVGSVNDDTMEAILLAQWGEHEANVRYGLPLLDRALDPRWEDIEAESTNFRHITTPTSGLPSELVHPPIIDPAIFDSKNGSILAEEPGELLALLDENSVISGQLALPIEGIAALLEEGALMGSGPVADLLAPFLYMAASQLGKPRFSTSRESINGRRCHTPGDRALVRTVLLEVEVNHNRCPVIRTSSVIRKDIGATLKVASARRSAHCRLVA